MFDDTSGMRSANSKPGLNKIDEEVSFQSMKKPEILIIVIVPPHCA